MNLLIKSLAVSLLLGPGGISTAFADESTSRQRRSLPNVVLLISDDAGWADFGFQGSDVIPTPHLDRLAAKGVRLSNAYSASVGSPARAALFTGKYHSRMGYEFNIGDDQHVIGTAPLIGLDPDELTLFKQLRKEGYKTGLVGKWHLGMQADNVQNGILFHPGNQPVHLGIDEFGGLLGNSRPYWGGHASGSGVFRYQTLSKNGTIRDIVAEDDIKGQYFTTVLGDMAIDFVRRHADSAAPFFLCTSFTAPHHPMEATEDDLATIDAMGKGLTGTRRTYAAMMLALDREIGRIIESLDDPDQDGDKGDSLTNDTLVIFTNDNGGDCCDNTSPSARNGILRGGKGSNWEGGIRVPMIVTGAGVDPSAFGSTLHDPVHLIDVFPTILAAIGVEASLMELDGVNLLPFINKQQTGPPHEHLYLRGGPSEQVAVRMGKWKLMHHRGTGFTLHDLDLHPEEREEHDVSADHPEVVERMKQIMTDYDVRVERPTWNVPNQMNRFRFRHADSPVANWSDPGVWYDLQFGNGMVTLSPWDGVADTGLAFWCRTGGKYRSVNDLTRVSGLPFIVNYLEMLPRDQPIMSDATTTIEGLPVLMTESLSGNTASLRLDSSSPAEHHVVFNFALPIQLYSDLRIQGNGNDEFRFTGGFTELNPGLTLTKTGQSKLILAAPNQLTGQIEILAGAIQVEHPNALGDASVIVRRAGKFISTVPLDPATQSRVTGSGSIVFANAALNGVINN